MGITAPSFGQEATMPVITAMGSPNFTWQMSEPGPFCKTSVCVHDSFTSLQPQPHHALTFTSVPSPATKGTELHNWFTVRMTPTVEIKSTVLSIQSLLREKKSSMAPSQTSLGNRTSKMLLCKYSLQPVRRTEITERPFLLPVQQSPEDEITQIHLDFQVPINSIPLHSHKRTWDKAGCRLLDHILHINNFLVPSLIHLLAKGYRPTACVVSVNGPPPIIIFLKASGHEAKKNCSVLTVENLLLSFPCCSPSLKIFCTFNFLYL